MRVGFNNSFSISNKLDLERDRNLDQKRTAKKTARVRIIVFKAQFWVHEYVSSETQNGEHALMIHAQLRHESCPS